MKLRLRYNKTMRHHLLKSIIYTSVICSGVSHGYEYLKKMNLADTDEVDKFLDDEDLEFTQIDKLEEKIEKNNVSYKPLAKKRKTKREKLNPDVFFAILKTNSVLFKIKEKGSPPVQSSKQIIVRAKEIYYGGTYSHIYDKKYKVAYKTKSTNLISIDKDVKLHPDYNPSIKYKRETHYLSHDKFFIFENQINLTFESHDLVPLTSYISSETNKAQANSFEYKVFPKTKLPLDFGAGVTLQSGSFINSASSENTSPSNHKWSAIFLGTSLRWNAYNYSDMNFFLETTAKRSLSYKLNNGQESYNFNNTLWQLSAEVDYITAFGKLACGVSYMNQSFSSKDAKENLIGIEADDSKSASAFSFYIGHRFEVKL